MKDESNMKV